MEVTQIQLQREYKRRLEHELQRRQARVHLADFVLYTYPSYQMGWFHKEVCEALDQFLADIKDKKSPRLILTAPPRHGKSELVSRRFPAFAFGQCPDLQIIATSYAADLSQRFNRDVQRIIDDDVYRQVFPDTTLYGKNIRTTSRSAYIRTSDLFEIVNHKGVYRSCGVGGGITGTGADCLIIDDPIKDRACANSPTIRSGIYDWFTSTAYTRLSPGGGVIVMATRWHYDDLTGRLIDKMTTEDGEKWQVINYPAIAEEEEQFRHIGEALHPERYSLKDLARIRESVGERDWAALYQQHPVPDGGGLFKEEWIHYYRKADLPSRFDKIVASWDMTFKDGLNSDYVVGQIWGRAGARFYLLDQVRGQMDFVKTKAAFIDLANLWPRATRKLVEDKANGPAIISELKDKVAGVIPVTPKESKEARAYAVSTLWEAGNVYIPDHSEAPWVRRDFEPELLSFPAGKHDDQVDAMTQALSDLKSHTLRIDPSNLRYLGIR